jgi:hypothetical protein
VKERGGSAHHCIRLKSGNFFIEGLIHQSFLRIAFEFPEIALLLVLYALYDSYNTPFWKRRNAKSNYE